MNNLFPTIRKNYGRGFTLVETLVAISIFVVVIVGPMSIAAKSMQSAYFANEQTTAIFLAQEAFESVRQLRDDSGLIAYNSNGSTDNAWSWHDSLDSACKGGYGCDIVRDPTNSNSNPTIKSCAGTNACKLKKYEASGGSTSNKVIVYGYGDTPMNKWHDTPFTRTVMVTEPVDNVSARVVVTVTWRSNFFGNVDRTVVLESWLYNQYKRYE